MNMSPDNVDPSQLKIITIKWGSRYPGAYANVLRDATRKFGLAESKFICFTDDPAGLAPGIDARPLPEIDLPERYRWTFWRKLALFDPALALDGPCLYLDLDVVLTDNLEPLLAGWNGHPRFIKNWLGAKTIKRGGYEHINSSVMLYDGGACGRVLEKFHADQGGAFSRYPTDQGYIYECLEDVAGFFTDGQCVSFKRHCLPRFPLNLILTPRVPEDARIVCFHGKPDPHEAAAGFRTGKLKHRCKPVPWIPLPATNPT